MSNATLNTQVNIERIERIAAKHKATVEVAQIGQSLPYVVLDMGFVKDFKFAHNAALDIARELTTYDELDQRVHVTMTVKMGEHVEDYDAHVTRGMNYANFLSDLS